MVTLTNVSMQFRMSNHRIDSIKEYFIRLMTRKLSYNEFNALSDVSFKIDKGEVVGVIGKNGAGKSTLLKVISGVMKPTKGSVEIKGRIAPLLELGAGFDYEMTAKENIYLNGALLGFDKNFLDQHYNLIVEFSELNEFMDQPLKNFSSGMVMRLGFTIATLIEPEILIVDEILSVGDYSFQKKSSEKMLELMNNGTTVIFVSHSLDEIKKICSKVIWLEKGCIKMMGSTNGVCDAYEESLN